MGSQTAEIAAWLPNGRMHSFEGWDDTVRGYVFADEVVEFLMTVAAMPSNPPPSKENS